jgi:predicted Rossmann fold flavoprotein
MPNYHTVVIGGGAAGICAAISQARSGRSVVICEKMPQIGKKILATGNGRCNLLNEDLNEIHYNQAARELVKTTFKRYDKSIILDFFKGLGLQVYSQDGRIFPVTNQAASVLKVLEMELKRLSVPIELNWDCTQILILPRSIQVYSRNGQKLECQKVIITGGGKTYPAFGSDGSIYTVVEKLGHTMVEPVPAAVPLVIKDNLCQILQGQRISAVARSVIKGQVGEEIEGELLFTKYGLSGTCILDISEAISTALNRLHQSDVFVSVDMVPFLDHASLKKELELRRKDPKFGEDMLVGVLPNKVSAAFRDLFRQADMGNTIKTLKDRRFKVSGTRGWNEAEFTCGGINVSEINTQTLESKIKKDIYFAGEVLDVNGRRGGYNLGWAWASGLAAGQTESRE